MKNQGEWTFEPTADGGTAIAWTYALPPFGTSRGKEVAAGTSIYRNTTVERNLDEASAFRERRTFYRGSFGSGGVLCGALRGLAPFS